MTYRKHGHVPSDDEIAKEGFKAFGPRRPAFVPTKDDFARAYRDLAVGDPEEGLELAKELAGLWPGWFGYPMWPFGWNDDDL